MTTLDLDALERAARAELRDVLDEIEAYFDNRADADQPAGSLPIPNEEMRLLVELRAARTKAGEPHEQE